MDVFRQRSGLDPWRSAFEAKASFAWMACACYVLLAWGFSGLPRMPLFLAFVLCIFFSAARMKDAAKIWRLRTNLLGKGMMLMPLAEYLDECDKVPEDLWLGLGFEWHAADSQRLYDLLRAEPKHVLPPPLYTKAIGYVIEKQDDRAAGLPWIHGVGEQESPIKLPFSLLEGNTLILGTTGAGKTTLLRLIIAACIRRGDCVIVIDPKSDLSLKKTMQQTCLMTPGREDDFLYFHPAFPSESCRYDVLKNFDRITSVAGRIASQIPSKTGSDAFVAFGWRTLLINSQLLVQCGDRPTIARLRRGIEGGLERLLERALVTFFEKARPDDWRSEAERFVSDAREGKYPKPSKGTEDRLVGYVAYYQSAFAQTEPCEAIDDGIALYNHDRGHYAKMITALTPVLAMLDSGDLGDLISPKYDDISDLRTIVDSGQVIDGGKVMYIGTDALSDATVSSALGSIIVSDLASEAGARYNYAKTFRRITLIIDESSEVANVALQQLASKGRGAGYTIFAASQTVPDWAARLNSVDKAQSTLGNFNNLFALRLKDTTTCEYVAEQFGQAFVDSKSFGLSTSSQSDSTVAGFTGSEGVQVGNQAMEAIPTDVMMKLPNHQYFALVAGGRLYKGRQPVLTS